MQSIEILKSRSAILLSLTSIAGLLLGGCAVDVAQQKTTHKAGLLKTETKFTSKEYGVAASERIVQSALAEIPRGGGRAQVGKPYKVRGRWYKPKHQPNYDKVGVASWYGPNFHGRKTANGEIFDQTALSAAHPTLPLPSYVRVTNVQNKRSVIVRVNDRGPFVGNRIIDLSYRTAELLGTRSGGLGKVRVQYIGKAPLHAQDEEFLVASYKGPGSVDDSRIAARNKLLAYAGLDPQAVEAPEPKKQKSPVVKVVKADPGALVIQEPASQVVAQNGAPLEIKPPKPFALVSADKPLEQAVDPTHSQAPSFVPALYETPNPIDETGRVTIKTDLNAYAPTKPNQRIEDAHDAFNQLVRDPSAGIFPDQPTFIQLGTYDDWSKAMALVDAAGRFGTVSVTPVGTQSRKQVSILLETKLPVKRDALLRLVSRQKDH